jgi:hypothetical protein
MSHPPHQHANEETIIVKEGTVEALVDGELKRVEQARSSFRRRTNCTASRTWGDAGHVLRDQMAFAGNVGETDEELEKSVPSALADGLTMYLENQSLLQILFAYANGTD